MRGGRAATCGTWRRRRWGAARTRSSRRRYSCRQPPVAHTLRARPAYTQRTHPAAPAQRTHPAPTQHPPYTPTPLSQHARAHALASRAASDGATCAPTRGRRSHGAAAAGRGAGRLGRGGGQRVREYLGSYLVRLNGDVDALVFTGGIGENSARVREMVCDGLQRCAAPAPPRADRRGGGGAGGGRAATARRCRIIGGWNPRKGGGADGVEVGRGRFATALGGAPPRGRECGCSWARRGGVGPGPGGAAFRSPPPAG